MKKKHDVNCFVTADVPPVYANRDDIERVVLNILTNSIKYTKEGGEIKIYVGFVYNDAYIKIFDNGIGQGSYKRNGRNRSRTINCQRNS